MAKKMAVKVSTKHQRQLKLSLPLKQSVRPLLVLLVGAAFMSLVWGLNHWWQHAMPVKKILLSSDNSQVTAEMIKNELFGRVGRPADSEELSESNEISDEGLLAIDMQWVHSRVQAMPWVKQVTVKKIWPDTLYFEVEEKQPLAKINQQLLLETGEMVRIIQPQFVSHLPIIEWPGVSEFEADDRLQMWKQFELVKNTLNEYQQELQKLTINNAGNWQLKTSEKMQIFLGRKLQGQRLERLLKSWKQITNRDNIESIDLRYSNGFAVKYKNEMTQPEIQAG